MPRKKRSSSPFELMDDDFDDDASSQHSANGNPPIQRNAANARERARMRVLSSAFGRLKTKLPNIPADTKLSKLDTLRLATMYIKQLKAVVEGETATSMADHHHNDGALNDTPSCYLQLHSGAQSMNWPFGLHHQVNHNSATRSHSVSSCSNTGPNNITTTTWCQTDSDNIKPASYETENYLDSNQHVENSRLHQDHHTSYLQTTSSAAHNAQEPVWYSETPSPDLSNSSSSAGLANYEAHQQRHSIMEHLSHMQLTPPPPQRTTTHSSASHNYQHQHHQPPHHNQNQYSHQHHHHTLQHVPHLHHHHHPAAQNLHHSFVNSSNLGVTSIR